MADKKEFGTLVKPGKRFSLDQVDPAATGPFASKEDPEAVAQLLHDLQRLADLQQKFFAEQKTGLLVVLQAMDTAGKDGVLRHVVGPLDSRGVQVATFKAPNSEELAHDYLWRVHQRTPVKGEMVFFNRSHYEDVLVVRVMNLVSASTWKKRYRHINEFERMLSESGTKVLKFFLHISKGEQKKRLKERITDPDKRWKFDPSDVESRKHWDEYMAAYDDALSECSTDEAPWIVVPADHKWYRNMVVARRLVEALEELNPKYPQPKNIDFDKIRID